LLGSKSFELKRGLTIIFGDNATGKTSLLEAIGYALRAKSIIHAKDYEVPTFGCSNFSVSSNLEGEKNLTTTVSWDERKSVRLNGKPVRSGKELIDAMKMVAITPATSLIATGSPRARREFLDDTASQINPSWASVISDYRTTVTERNAWLKNEFGGRKMLEVLTDNIIKFGTQVRIIREQVANELKESLFEEKIAFSFTSSGNLTQQEFTKVYQKEKAREQTIIGPHKDDWSLMLDNHQVDRFASTGQARKVTLTLKLAQAKLIRRITGIEPIILADDLFAELDKARGKQALIQMEAFGQVLITCAQKPPDGNYVLIESNSWANH
jgi:DNA replication and repair protein RecF